MYLVSTENYSISQLDSTTWLVWDQSKNIPTPHYYQSYKAALKKCESITLKAV